MSAKVQTPLGKEEQKRLNQIIQQLIDSTDSTEFRQPVDHVGLGLEDYLNIVKNPIDLSTVHKKLHSNKYRVVEECLDDLQMIWDNCKVYNAMGSWIWKLADKLERSFKKYVKNYLPLVALPLSRLISKPELRGSGTTATQDVFTEEAAESISYNDKVEFANNLKQLQPEQVGAIVHMIQNSSGSALTEVDKERYQIVVDNIDTEVFNKCAK